MVADGRGIGQDVTQADRGHSSDRCRSERLDVVELTTTSSLFGVIFEPDLQHSFERGRFAATTEAIASILPALDAFISRQKNVTAEEKELLYRFERFLAQRLDESSTTHHWVEGGGGI